MIVHATGYGYIAGCKTIILEDGKEFMLNDLYKDGETFNNCWDLSDIMQRYAYKIKNLGNDEYEIEKTARW